MTSIRNGTDLTEAFASAGLDDGSSWRFSGHLANMPLYYEFKDDGCDLTAGEESIKGTYLDNFKTYGICMYLIPQQILRH